MKSSPNCSNEVVKVEIDDYGDCRVTRSGSEAQVLYKRANVEIPPVTPIMNPSSLLIPIL